MSFSSIKSEVLCPITATPVKESHASSTKRDIYASFQTTLNAPFY